MIVPVLLMMQVVTSSGVGVPADPVAAHLMAFEAAREKGDAAEAAANLWRAADTADRKQREYARALELYDRLLKEYPAARLARGAETRRDYVRRATAKGEEPFRRFETVRADYARLKPADARKEIDAIRREFPDFPLGDELVMWIADRAAETRDWKEARAQYREVVESFPESALAGYAWAGIARASFELGEYEEAEKAFGRVAGSGVAGAEFVSKKEIERVQRHVRREKGARVIGSFLALVLIAAALTIDPRRVRDASRRSVGKELLYLAPLLGVLVLIAPSDARLPLATVAIVGLVWLLLAITWAESAKPALARARAASALLATAGGAAALYVVLYALDLLVAVERIAGV